MNTAYITHPDCLKHDIGPTHPERPGRLRAIEDQLIASRLFDLLRHYDAPKSTRQQLLRVHDTTYVDMIMTTSPAEGLAGIDPDTFMNPHTVTAALRAAGALVLATDLVLTGEVHNAFCCIRPPGHHAKPGQAMGFCFFNNVAIGVAHALERHGLQRIAILDLTSIMATAPKRCSKTSPVSSSAPRISIHFIQIP